MLKMYNEPPANFNELIDRMIENLRIGWCRGLYFFPQRASEPTACCLLGARTAAGVRTWDTLASELYFRASNKGVHSLADFNDEAESVDVVIAFLEGLKDGVVQDSNSS